MSKTTHRVKDALLSAFMGITNNCAHHPKSLFFFFVNYWSFIRMQAEVKWTQNLEPYANWPNFIPQQMQEIQFLHMFDLIENKITPNMGLVISHLKWKVEKITKSRYCKYTCTTEKDNPERNSAVYLLLIQWAAPLDTLRLFSLSLSVPF